MTAESLAAMHQADLKDLAARLMRQLSEHADELSMGLGAARDDAVAAIEDARDEECECCWCRRKAC